MFMKKINIDTNLKTCIINFLKIFKKQNFQSELLPLLVQFGEKPSSKVLTGQLHVGGFTRLPRQVKQVAGEPELHVAHPGAHAPRSQICRPDVEL